MTVHLLLTQFLAFLKRRWPTLYRRTPDFWQLMRMHRPIGIFLLLWPTLWCLWIAGKGHPSLANVVIFTLGTVCMRAAGCCINDYADRNIDGRVKRTAQRPLATGKITPKEALLCCAVLCVIAFLLVLLTNKLTIEMSFAGLVLALIYPFMKRHTHMAQVFLGAAFSWGGMMAFTAQTNGLPPAAWLLYIGNVLWTVVYDTEYAMVDRNDDLKIGVKSTAILFAEADRVIIGFLQAMSLWALLLAGRQFELGRGYYAGLVAAGFMFFWQQHMIRNRDREGCFRAFLQNNYVGLAIFAGTLVNHFGG
ncbi:MAG TPA: 4-hydroxybenzoate octaprenyltransferase [Candidatus Acidoferrum sp.]|nr:4-hydroxybenzoate octaprenyltransferase [Candidatus Acidoferrum sp.]